MQRPGLQDEDAKLEVPTIPLRHLLHLNIEIPAGGWALWVWGNEGVIPWSNVSYVRDLNARFYPAEPAAQPFWSGLYIFEARHGFGRIGSPYTQGFSFYRNATEFSWYNEFLWGGTTSRRQWEVAYEGLLVFSQAAGSFEIELVQNGPPADGHGPGETQESIPKVSLDPIASGAGIETAFHPPAEMDEILVGSGESFTTKIPTFQGGFAAMWMMTESVAPHAYSAEGPYRLKLPTGQQFDELHRAGYPSNADPKECTTRRMRSPDDVAAIPTICRRSVGVGEAGLLADIAKGCVSSGELAAETAIVGRGPVRYTPVLIGIPVNFCNYLPG